MSTKDHEPRIGEYARSAMPWFGVVPPYDPFNPMGTTTGGQGVSTTTITIGNIQPRVIAQGWQCPKCCTIYAPHVDKCSNCKGE